MTVRRWRVWLGLLLVLAPPLAWSTDWKYRVRPGDNLWNLSETYLIDVLLWRQVQTRNRVADPWNMPPGTVLQIPTRWLKTIPAHARVIHTQGRVERTTADARQRSQLAAGDTLQTGHVVETAPDATATLEFVEGARLRLQPGSTLYLERLVVYGQSGVSLTRLHLRAGRLETLVPPRKLAGNRFEITTPAAVTSVRGTEYRVSADPDAASRAEVLSGRVAVGGAGLERQIPAGFGTVVQATRPPSPPIVLPPPPRLGALPDTFERVPIQFQLPPLDADEGYRVQIAADAAFQEVLFDRFYATARIQGPDLPDGRYHLRVRQVRKDGLEGRNAHRPFVLNARPQAPLAIRPEPNAGVTEETPRFEWSGAKTIHRYRLQIARDIRFARPIVDRAGIADTHHTLHDRLPLGDYYWRVAAVHDTEGQGPFSDPQPFRRVLPAPQIGEPETKDGRLVLRWRAGLPGQKYDVQMAKDEDFTRPLLDTRTDTARLEISPPDPGKYWIRVRSIDPDGFVGPYGTPQSIEMPAHRHRWLLLALPLFALFAL